MLLGLVASGGLWWPLVASGGIWWPLVASSRSLVPSGRPLVAFWSLSGSLWRPLVASGDLWDLWWPLVAVRGCWLSYGGFWWPLVASGGLWWPLAALWQPLVASWMPPGGFWWPLVAVGWLSLVASCGHQKYTRDVRRTTWYSRNQELNAWPTTLINKSSKDHVDMGAVWWKCHCSKHTHENTKSFVS